MRKIQKGGRSAPKARSPKTASKTPRKTKPKSNAGGQIAPTHSWAYPQEAGQDSPSSTTIIERLLTRLKSGWSKISKH